MLALLVGATLLVVLHRTLTLPPPTGPAPLWVSLLAVAAGYAACCAVAGALGMAVAVVRPRDR